MALRSSTRHSRPCRRNSQAQLLPPGPPPTMMVSTCRIQLTLGGRTCQRLNRCQHRLTSDYKNETRPVKLPVAC